jgi:hypothetical protein
MLRVVAVVVDGVERWGIEDRERAMSILAVQTFLIAVDPYMCVSSNAKSGKTSPKIVIMKQLLTWSSN